MYHLEILLKDLPEPVASFKAKALTWADSFQQVAYYDSNQISFPHHGFENFLAVSNTFLLINPEQALESLQTEIYQQKQVLCCILNYELKNEIESLTSSHSVQIPFPSIHYFYPEVQLHFELDKIIIYSIFDNCFELVQAIMKQTVNARIAASSILFKPRILKNEYIKQVNQLKQRIWEGDVYELNFCQEFYATVSDFNPITALLRLNALSPMPFAGFYKVQDCYLMCASPERFLKKTNNLLLSQPIKGTIRRGTTQSEDAQLKQDLASDEKEIAENMMIMDLVRNDLARCSVTGSIQVEEMFAVYSFRQVHQMITTIQSRVSDNALFTDIIQSTFPMGSMTGAPKLAALRLIDQYEAFARGLYSGSLGYIWPSGDFDFNVVIRSLQYDRRTGYLAYAVGSAITYDSDPEKEYAECELKSKAILEILQ